MLFDTACKGTCLAFNCFHSHYETITQIPNGAHNQPNAYYCQWKTDTKDNTTNIVTYNLQKHHYISTYPHSNQVIKNSVLGENLMNNKYMNWLHQ